MGLPVVLVTSRCQRLSCGRFGRGWSETEGKGLDIEIGTQLGQRCGLRFGGGSGIFGSTKLALRLEGMSVATVLKQAEEKTAAGLYGAICERAMQSTRGGPMFNAFPYPTKISPGAIALYIAAHTELGVTVLDGFSGDLLRSNPERKRDRMEKCE